MGEGLRVNQRFRDIIEAFEPRGRQVFPIDLLGKGEVQWQTCLFIVCQRLHSLLQRPRRAMNGDC